MPAETLELEQATEQTHPQLDAQLAEVEEMDYIPRQDFLRSPEAIQLIDAGLSRIESGAFGDDEAALKEFSHRLERVIAQTDGGQAYFHPAWASELPHTERLQRDMRVLKTLVPHIRNKEFYYSLFQQYYAKDLTPGSENYEKVESLWEDPEFIDRAQEQVTKAYEYTSGEFAKLREEDLALLEALTARCGFNKNELSDMVQCWESHHKAGDRYMTFQESLIRIVELSSADPESAHMLYETFGIRHFSRYTFEELSRQNSIVKEGNGIEGPAVLVVSATWDRNAALARAASDFGEVIPIYAEASTSIEVARRMITARKIAGKPLNGLIINAHGGPDAIRLGPSENHPRGLTGDVRSLTQGEIRESRSLPRLHEKDIFTPSAELVLMACSTGQDGGFAETISKLSSIDTWAFSDTASSRLRLTENGKHEIYDRSEKSPVVRFVAGQRQEDADTLNLYD